MNVVSDVAETNSNLPLSFVSVSDSQDTAPSISSDTPIVIQAGYRGSTVFNRIAQDRLGTTASECRHVTVGGPFNRCDA